MISNPEQLPISDVDDQKGTTAADENKNILRTEFVDERMTRRELVSWLAKYVTTENVTLATGVAMGAKVVRDEYRKRHHATKQQSPKTPSQEIGSTPTPQKP